MTDNLKEALYTKLPLRFNENGKYKILMVSDLHGGVGFKAKKTVAALQALIDTHKPDLVLLGGDIAGPGHIHIENGEQLKEMLDQLVSPMENSRIPWAHVYGNHDDNYGLVNKEHQPIYESYPYCVSKAGPEEISGVGNYVLPIYDANGEKILFNVFGYDSNQSVPELKEEFGISEKTEFHHATPCTGGDYDGIHFDQVMWYYKTSVEMEKYNGAKIPAMAFMHIPVPEMAYGAVDRTKFKYQGGQCEDVYCSIINYGMCGAALQRGDIKTMCFGHNHTNDYRMNYAGIDLFYDGFLSYHACHEDKIRGGRIFEIDATNPWEINSYMVRVRDILGEKGDSNYPLNIE